MEVNGIGINTMQITVQIYHTRNMLSSSDTIMWMDRTV